MMVIHTLISQITSMIVMQALGCFELVYVKYLMKSQSHKTRSCTIWTLSHMFHVMAMLRAM